MNAPQPDPEPARSCRNLRCNQMYYLGAGHEDEYMDTGVFWCSKTQEVFGPDGQPIGRRECCTGRTCFVE